MYTKRVSRRELAALNYFEQPDADLSLSAISKDLGVSTTQCSRIIRSLKDKGLLAIRYGRHQRIVGAESKRHKHDLFVDSGRGRHAQVWNQLSLFN